MLDPYSDHPFVDQARIMAGKIPVLGRWIRDINEHSKAHQSGTIMGLIGTIIAPIIVGLAGAPVWCATAVWIALLITVASCAAWYSASNKAMELEEKIKPKLRMFFDPSPGAGCVIGDDL